MQAFHVLDVHRGNDVDARQQQIVDFQIALGILRAGDVGKRQFVNDANRGITFENGVNVEHFDRGIAVRDLFAGNDFQAFQQGFGFLASVRFHPADDDVHARFFEAMGFFEHGVGFAHAGGMAEIDFELAQAALFDEPQEILRF